MPFTYSGKRMGKEKKNTEEDMCGICGFTGYRQDQKDIIEKMMRSIAHRGPDSAGSFCDEKNCPWFSKAQYHRSGRRTSAYGKC